jgi:hypothetical protein
VDGTGTTEMPVPGTSDIYTVLFQKMDDNSETMTVQVLRDGKVIKEGSTDASYGVLTLGGFG